MAGMTKKQCQQFEKLVTEELTRVLGAGAEYLETALQWTMPHANGATVTLTLFRDSFDVGNVYRSSWLACKLNKPAEWLDSDGYTKPYNELPWPSGGFTYPSGKNNLHVSGSGDLAQWRRELALHLYRLAAPGSSEREAFGAIEWEAV